VSSASDDHKSTVSTTAVEDRRLRNLRKKLDQIEALKERQQCGDTLEANQVCSTSCCYTVQLVCLAIKSAVDKYISVLKHIIYWVAKNGTISFVCLNFIKY